MFTVREAALKLGVSRLRLYLMAAHREIAHYRVGGKILFSDADIDAYLASRRVDAVIPQRIHLRDVRV